MSSIEEQVLLIHIALTAPNLYSDWAIIDCITSLLSLWLTELAQ